MQKKIQKKDKAKREEIDVRNNADQLVYQTEKQIDELGDKIDDSSKKEVLDIVEKIKSLKDGSDIGKLKSAIDDLNKKWAELSQKIYSQNSNSDASSAEASSVNQNDSSNDDNIEDADFEVMDDEK